jgi:hypothetical protein
MGGSSLRVAGQVVLPGAEAERDLHLRTPVGVQHLGGRHVQIPQAIRPRRADAAVAVVVHVEDGGIVDVEDEHVPGETRAVPAGEVAIRERAEQPDVVDEGRLDRNDELGVGDVVIRLLVVEQLGVPLPVAAVEVHAVAELGGADGAVRKHRAQDGQVAEIHVPRVERDIEGGEVQPGAALERRRLGIGRERRSVVSLLGRV